MSFLDDYYEECISNALEDEGIKATRQQIENVAGAVAGARENEGMVTGHDCIPNPLESTIRENEQAYQSEIKMIETLQDKRLKELQWEIRRLNGIIYNLQQQTGN